MANSYKKDIQPRCKLNRNQAKGQTKFKIEASRKFRRISKQRLSKATYEALPESLFEISNIWDSPSDGFSLNANTRVSK